MKRPLLAVALLALATVAGAVSAKTPSDPIAAAIADPARPATDKAQDAHRKPAEVLAFAGIHRGDVVVDLMPGSGYYTRLFSRLVGPTGKVYALDPSEMAKVASKPFAALKAFAGKGEYANVVVLEQPVDALELPQPADLVWTSQNYHDLQFGLSHDEILDLDRAIYAALKPGGVLLVIDHVAAPGSGWSVARTLHRIDPDAIKADMMAAGFVLDAESDLLRNPADPHTATVFDPSIRGKTDQVVLKFRKPG